MPAKKPFKKVVAFKQVSKLSKFRKKKFFWKLRNFYVFDWHKGIFIFKVVIK